MGYSGSIVLWGCSLRGYSGITFRGYSGNGQNRPHDGPHIKEERKK